MFQDFNDYDEFYPYFIVILNVDLQLCMWTTQDHITYHRSTYICIWHQTDHVA